MTIVSIPRTGQTLSSLGLGTASLGNLGQTVSDVDAFATIALAWQAGIRYFDSAPFYGYGLAERRLGLALRAYPREQFLLSTKAGRRLVPLSQAGTAEFQPGGSWQQPPPFASVYDYSASGIRRSVEDSLQRLGVDYLDIALVHDIGEVTHGSQNAHYWAQLTNGGWATLRALKQEKLIGAIGLGVNEWQVIAAAQRETELDCAMLAGRYSLLEQGSLPFMNQCAKDGVAIFLGGVFNSGLLASDLNSPATYNYVTAPPAVLAHARALNAICIEFNVSLAAAAAQFARAHPAVKSTVLGPASPTQLEQIMGWTQQTIPAAFWRAMQKSGLIEPTAPLPIDSTQ